jgi:hypothetical protein
MLLMSIIDHANRTSNSKFVRTNKDAECERLLRNTKRQVSDLGLIIATILLYRKIELRLPISNNRTTEINVRHFGHNNNNND